VGGRGPSIGPSALQCPGEEGFTISRFLDTVSRSDVPGTRSTTANSVPDPEVLPSQNSIQAEHTTSSIESPPADTRNPDPVAGKRSRQEDGPTLTRSKVKRIRAMNIDTNHTE
jgi:hypothetical protein